MQPAFSISTGTTPSAISPNWGIAAAFAFFLVNRFAPTPKPITTTVYVELDPPPAIEKLARATVEGASIQEALGKIKTPPSKLVENALYLACQKAISVPAIIYRDKSPAPEIEALANAIVNESSVETALNAIEMPPSDLIEKALYLVCKELTAAKLEIAKSKSIEPESFELDREAVSAAARALFATGNWVNGVVEFTSSTITSDYKAISLTSELIRKELLKIFQYREFLDKACLIEDLDGAIINFIRFFYKVQIAMYRKSLLEKYPALQNPNKDNERDIALLTLFDGDSVADLEYKLTVIIDNGFLDEIKALFLGKPLPKTMAALEESGLDPEIIALMSEVLTGMHLPETSRNLLERKRLEFFIGRRNEYQPEDAPKELNEYVQHLSKPFQDIVDREISERLSTLKDDLEKSLVDSSNLFGFAMAYAKLEAYLESLPMTLEVDFDPKKILLEHVRKKIEKAETKEEAEKIRSEYQTLTGQLKWTVDNLTQNTMRLIINSKPTATQEMD